MKKSKGRIILSIILVCCLLIQTTIVGTVAAARLTVSETSDVDAIIQTYSNTGDYLSGTHTFSNGRAGTFIFNDFSLQSRLQLNTLSINSNIYPVSIVITYGAPEYLFLTDYCNETCRSMGGFLTNYHSFLRELVYTDTSILYWFPGDGSCRAFEKNTENGVTTWLSDEDGTVITEIQSNNEITYSAFLENGETYLFDELGRLIQQTNATANINLQIEYQSGTNVPFDAISQITDGIGNTFCFSYTNGHVTKIKCYTPNQTPIIAGDGLNAAPLEMQFVYTGDQLTGVTFPDGETVNISYTVDGNVSETVNIDAAKLQMTYSSGKLSGITTTAYDAATETDLTNETLSILSVGPLSTRFADGYGHWQTKSFLSDGSLISIVDENNNYIFGEPDPEPDPNPDPNTDPEPEPAVPSATGCICSGCEEYNCPCTCEDEEDCTCPQCQRRTYTETDAYGNVTAEKEYDGIKTRQETNTYTANGAYLADSTDTAGNQVAYSYSNAGFMTSVSSGSSVGTMKYDSMGNLTEFSQSVTGLADGQQMKNEYTYEDDRLASISHNGFTYDFIYDVWGNQKQVKIGNRVLSQNTYGTGENKNRLSQTEFANGQKLCYSYNNNGEMSGVRYNNENTDRYSYTYDADGALQSVTDNSTGNVTTYTDAGVVQTAADDTVLFEVTEGTDGAFSETVFGAVGDYESAESYNSATGITSQTKSFEHTITNIDPDIQEEVSMTTGVTFADTTDWFNRTVSKSADFSTEISEDDNGLFSGGMTKERTYTYADTASAASDRISTITDTVTVGEDTTTTETHYEYDFVGNITGIFHYEENMKVYDVRYAYDEANQIVREDNRAGNWTILYQYDVGGNIVSKTTYDFTLGSVDNLSPTKTNTYTYGDSTWGDVLTAFNGQPITYDAMGNVTSIGDETFVWNGGRQLASRIDSEGSSITYNYNADGQISRTHKVKANGEPEETVDYVWDGDRLAATCRTDYKDDGTGNYIPDESNVTRYLYDADGEPMGFTVADMLTFVYTKNIFGDIAGISYIDGTPLVDFVYDAYGDSKGVAHEPADPDDQVKVFVLTLFAGVFNVLNYRGYAYAGGFDYLGSRFYSNKLCRFLNADVYEDTQTGVVGTNMFAYCNNNPITFVDPDGRATQSKATSFISTIKSFVSIFVRVVKMITSLAITQAGYSSSGDLTQSQMRKNAKIVYDKLTTLGWSKRAICATLGNLQHESVTINPAKWQGGVGPGYGIAQWDPASKYLNWAKSNGYKSDSLIGQVIFLDYSMQPGNGEWFKNSSYPNYYESYSDFIKSTKSVDYLTSVFMYSYERPSVPHLEERKKYSQQWYQYFS